MVQITETAGICAAGIIGALAFLAGLVLLAVSPIVGLVVIVIGILVGAFGRPKHTVLVCPACKNRIRL